MKKEVKKISWEFFATSGRCYSGNWFGWGEMSLEKVYQAAKLWRNQLSGVNKPWLCWHLNDEWCRLQQKMVLEVGWTPVVGTDNTTSSKTVIDGALLINFNEFLGAEHMHSHFLLEFIFLFCEKLAFWHCDFLCDLKEMQRLASIFETLVNGEIAAAYSKSSIWPWSDNKNRYFELVCCLTKDASLNQFENGMGWWRNFSHHPNFDTKKFSNYQNYHWEHGAGVLFWEREGYGKVTRINVNEKKYHFNMYTRQLQRMKSKIEELSHYDVRDIAKNLGITQFL